LPAVDLSRSTIAPIKANLPRGRDAKPRVSFILFGGKEEDRLVTEGDQEASFPIVEAWPTTLPAFLRVVFSIANKLAFLSLPHIDRQSQVPPVLL
jgi:hypothetical protein